MTLLIPLLLAFPQQAEESSLVPQEILVDQTLAIINDQVLTMSDLEREFSLLLKERGLSADHIPMDQKLALTSRALQTRLVDMLFHEGFRMSGMDPEILTRGAVEEIRKRQEDAGSVATYALQLASRGTNIENETKRVKQQLVAVLFRRSELGLSPELGATASKALLEPIPTEIQAWFQNHPAEVTTEASMEAQLLVIMNSNFGSPETGLDEIATALASGQITFDDAAQEHSVYRPSEGGRTGVFQVEDSALQTPVMDFLATAEANQISPPLQLASGWALAKLLKSTPAGSLSFTEASPAIRQYLRRQKERQLLRSTVERLRRHCYLWLQPSARMALDAAFMAPQAELSEEL